MIITDKQLQYKYLTHVGDGKVYSFFKVLHTGELSFDPTHKSRVYIAYVGGNWYAYNGSRRKSSVRVPEEGKELFAYGNDCFWMRTKDMGVDVANKKLPLDMDTHVFLWTYCDAGQMGVFIADGSRCTQPIVTSMKKDWENQTLAVMSIIALIRQYDASAADQIEQFWLGEEKNENEDGEEPPSLTWD